MTVSPNIIAAEAVTAMLRQLIDDRQLLDVSYNDGRDTVKTMLLDLDNGAGRMIIDAPRDEDASSKMVQANKLHFVGVMQGCKVQFLALGVRRLDYEGDRALSVGMPRGIERTQHRNAYRLKVSNAHCRLPTPASGIVKVPITDISLGGVRLMVGNAADGFFLRQMVPSCQIRLGELSFTCNIEIRSVKLQANRMAAMGCRFVGLPAAAEMSLVRYVTEKQSTGRHGKSVGFLRRLFSRSS